MWLLFKGGHYNQSYKAVLRYNEYSVFQNKNNHCSKRDLLCISMICTKKGLKIKQSIKGMVIKLEKSNWSKRLTYMRSCFHKAYTLIYCVHHILYPVGVVIGTWTLVFKYSVIGLDSINITMYLLQLLWYQGTNEPILQNTFLALSKNSSGAWTSYNRVGLLESRCF